MTIREYFNSNPPNKSETRSAYCRRIQSIAVLDGRKSSFEAVRTKSKKWQKNWGQIVGDSYAKVLVFDIETAPAKAWIWSKWQKGISDNQITNDWFILCWSAKWLFNDKVMSMSLKPKEVKSENDERITKGLWSLLNEADVVIAHNLLKFDEKRANTRFFMHGLNPPSPYQKIDTLIHARKKFAYLSNRLDFLVQKLNLGQKINTGGFSLWQRCLDGEKEAMTEMSVYCEGDVRLLEDVYLRMRAWIMPHPNIGIMVDTTEPTCCTCGSTNLQLDGDYKTTVQVYNNFRCLDCGSLSRGRKTQLSLKQSSGIMSSVPR